MSTRFAIQKHLEDQIIMEADRLMLEMLLSGVGEHGSRERAIKAVKAALPDARDRLLLDALLEITSENARKRNQAEPVRRPWQEPRYTLEAPGGEFGWRDGR